MRTISVCTLLFLLSNLVFAQKQDKMNVNSAYQQTIDKVFVDQSLDYSLKFGGYLTALASFVGSQSNTITLQPTVYALSNLIHGRSTTIDTTFAKEVFARNSQINLGFTPNAKNLFGKPSDYQVGFTYAILNNKDIPLQDFDVLTGPWKHFSDMQDTLNHYFYQLDPTGKNADVIRMNAIADSGYYSLLPDSIYKYLKQTYAEVLDKDFQTNIIDSLSKSLSRQPLLTIGVNATYTLSDYWWDDFTFKATYSKYLFRRKGSFVDPSVDVTATYSLQDDTAKVGKNSGRRVAQLLAEINLRGSIFEVRPGISCTHVPNGLYEKEKQDKISPTAELDVKIANKTVVAFTIKYDNDTKLITGGLKLQSSLK
jgi:hypothetical protein